MIKSGTLKTECPYAAYYLNQAGNGIPVFRGTLHQRGHGLGSIFSSLFKLAKPLFNQGGRYLARQALKTGSSIANDVLAGENLRHSIKRQFENTGRSLVNDTANYLEKIQQGNGPHPSHVNKKRRKQPKLVIKKLALKNKRRDENVPRKNGIIRRTKTCTAHNKKKNQAKKKKNIPKKKKKSASKKKLNSVDKLF